MEKPSKDPQPKRPTRAAARMTPATGKSTPEAMAMDNVRTICNKFRTPAATALKRFNIRVAKSCRGFGDLAMVTPERSI